MFGFFGFILLFILFIVLFVLAIFGQFIRAIFNFGKRTPKHYGNASSSQRTESTHTNAQNIHTSKTSEKKKIFKEDEGEYVEFEEIK